MSVKGGALEFDIVANNKQMISALEETQKRVQGLSDATVSGGEVMDEAFEQAAKDINKAFQDIDRMTDIHQAALRDLEAEYTRLGEVAGRAFMAGSDEEYRALTEKQQAIKGEITLRKQLLDDIGKQSDALADSERTLENQRKKIEDVSKSHVTFRTRIRNVREELIAMEQDGKRSTAQYAALQQELGRLQDAMDDANQQGRVLANDEADFQGIISGVNGIVGAFSAAQGAIGLFASENENLQKIMLKVQSLMAITIGLQQVSQALNKDSAFMLVTVAKAKQLLATSTLFLGKAFVKMGLSATSAKIAVAGLYATLTLGLSLAITGIVYLINKHNEKQEEAKKKAEEATEAYKKQQERLDDLAKKYGEQVATIETMRNALYNENLSYNEKLKIIKKLQEIVPDYTAKLTKEGEVIWDNKEAIDSYLNSLEKTLRYKSALEDLTNIYKDIYKAERGEDGGFEMYPRGLNKREFSDIRFKQMGLKSTDTQPGMVLTQIEKEWDLYQKQADERAQRLEGLKGKVKDINKYITDNGLLDISTNNDSGKGTPKDHYSEMLEKRKQLYVQYLKWVNSGDTIIQQAAQKEFAGLLAQGNSYIEYLNKQRQKLLDLSSRTPEENKRLFKLNDEIANETKNTVLNQFEKDLQTQLNGAHSIMEMLNILEERRKALENDNSGLKGEKTTIVDKEQEDVGKKAKEETDLLLNQYSEYLSKRIGKNLEFENQMQLLRQRATKAETEEERKRIQGIATLYEQLHALQIESFEELDQINADSIYRLGTFEQKRLQITKVYEKLIGAARIAGQKDVAKKLEGERDLEILKESQQYKEFFGDISEISLKTLENTRKTLLSMMKAAFEAGKMTADQYKQIIDSINKQMDSAYSGNGRGIEALFGNNKGGGFMNMFFGEGDFKSKIDGFKNIFSGAKGDMANIASTSGEVAGNAGEAAKGMQGAAGGAAGALGMIDAIITAVYQTIKGVTELMDSIAKYKESMGKDADGLNEWSAALNTMNEGVMGTWEKLKSGDVIGSMTNSISWILDMGTLFNTIHDNRIEKSIQQHADAVNVLSNAYKALAWSINKALGETVYKNQKAAIDNMRQQQAHLLQMKNDEESKKKTDDDKVREYQEQYDELGRQVQDMISSIADSITQTTAKDLSNELADALVEAFGRGEDAATAFEEVSRKVMQNAVKNALKLQFLEKPLQNAIDQLQKDMGFDEEGNGGFDGLSQAEQDRFKNKILSIGGNFAEAMKMYEDLFKDLEDNSDPTTSLSGTIKGASQESIDLLAGQTNAVRINQVEGNEILRQQLIHLASMDAKIGISNKHLESIDNKINNSNSDPLRAQGIN